MRRAKSSPGLTPAQLKHFAVAAVAITGLLALFASGQDWGARAQVEAVQAKNDLMAKQAKKLGTDKIGTSLAVRAGGSEGFGEAAGPGSMGSVSGGGSVGAPVSEPSAPQINPRPPHIPPVPLRQGQSYTFAGTLPGTAADRATNRLADVQKGMLSAEQSRQIKAVSRQRSGGPDQDD